MSDALAGLDFFLKWAVRLAVVGAAALVCALGYGVYRAILWLAS
jgi:hypothetical protein